MVVARNGGRQYLYVNNLPVFCFTPTTLLPQSKSRHHTEGAFFNVVITKPCSASPTRHCVPNYTSNVVGSEMEVPDDRVSECGGRYEEQKLENSL